MLGMPKDFAKNRDTRQGGRVFSADISTNPILGFAFSEVSIIVWVKVI
jgi:hypothetical protein